MLKIGLTGGIGTGKSTVASIFYALGIPILDADRLAKQLIGSSPELQAKIQSAFGPSSFSNGVYQTGYISSIVFNDPVALDQLNSIVHPFVKAYTQEWFQERTEPYAVKEAAILFEAGMDKELDFVIGVDAPEAIRLYRVQTRDHLSPEDVRERMARQMDNREKMALCHFVIQNDDRTSLIEQVLHIHNTLSEYSK